jgi:hypothetical protein
MEELPNPLQSINTIGDGLTTKIAGKLSKVFRVSEKVKEFFSIFPL